MSFPTLVEALEKRPLEQVDEAVPPAAPASNHDSVDWTDIRAQPMATEILLKVPRKKKSKKKSIAAIGEWGLDDERLPAPSAELLDSVSFEADDQRSVDDCDANGQPEEREGESLALEVSGFVVEPASRVEFAGVVPLPQCIPDEVDEVFGGDGLIVWTDGAAADSNEVHCPAITEDEATVSEEGALSQHDVTSTPEGDLKATQSPPIISFDFLTTTRSNDQSQLQVEESHPSPPPQVITSSLEAKFDPELLKYLRRVGDPELTRVILSLPSAFVFASWTGDVHVSAVGTPPAYLTIRVHPQGAEVLPHHSEETPFCQVVGDKGTISAVLGGFLDMSQALVCQQLQTDSIPSLIKFSTAFRFAVDKVPGHLLASLQFDEPRLGSKAPEGSESSSITSAPSTQAFSGSGLSVAFARHHDAGWRAADSVELEYSMSTASPDVPVDNPRADLPISFSSMSTARNYDVLFEGTVLMGKRRTRCQAILDANSISFTPLTDEKVVTRHLRLVDITGVFLSNGNSSSFAVHTIPRVAQELFETSPLVFVCDDEATARLWLLAARAALRSSCHAGLPLDASQLSLDVMPFATMSSGQTCATCGKTLYAGVFGNARWCDYMGSWHCTSCHINDRSIIPARAVAVCDIRYYRVCRAALAFLESIKDQPLLTISEEKHKESKEFLIIFYMRLQLRHMTAFIKTCPQKDMLLNLAKPRFHLLWRSTVYSLTDLEQIASGALTQFLKKLVVNIQRHITMECEVYPQRYFHDVLRCAKEKAFSVRFVEIQAHSTRSSLTKPLSAPNAGTSTTCWT